MLWTKLISAASDPYYVSESHTFVQGSNTVTVNANGAVKGDLLLAVIAGSFNNNNTAFSCPFGWTAANSFNGAATLCLAYTTYDGLSNSFVFTSPSDGDILTTIMIISGAKWDAAGAPALDGGVANSVNVTENSSILFGAWLADSNTADWSLPSGMSAVYAQKGQKPGVLISYQYANGGASGVRTSTSPSTTKAIAQLFSVKPA
jgi:hypothetical protein